MNERERVPSGPKPDTLRIEDNPADTIRRIFNVPKPEGGWPKPERRERAKKKEDGK